MTNQEYYTVIVGLFALSGSLCLYLGRLFTRKNNSTINGIQVVGALILIVGTIGVMLISYLPAFIFILLLCLFYFLRKPG